MLVASRGPGAGTRLPLTLPVTSVGRDPDADLVLDDVTVSRRHAEFRRDTTGITVVDAGSLNGIFHNRTPVAGSVALAPGDEVQIGKTRFMVVTVATAAAQTSPVLCAASAD